MKEIKLSGGLVALVDDGDYEWLSQFKWSRSGKTGYAMRSVNGKGVYMHRVIMNATPDVEVDHINGSGLDNRKKNLRLCKHSDNIANQHKWNRPTSSKYKGVCLIARNPDVWMAYVGSKKKRKYLGEHKSEEAAARAYNRGALEMFGEYARLNEIDDDKTT